VDYSTEIQPIFNDNCSGCHIGSTFGGLDLSEGGSFANLVNVTSQNYSPAIRIVPYDPNSSVLYNKITNTGIYGGAMPQGSSGLSESDAELIATWINEGANETSQLSIISENRFYPDKVSIIRNFPNPFNPVTHFQVFSPIAQQGKVSIINLSGQKVVDLGVVHLNPGNQIFSWDHQTFINLPSGQYLIKLKTDELMATHKITLVK
jgi:hypothetical protein